jgi:hypothetical protein
MAGMEHYYFIVDDGTAVFNDPFGMLLSDDLKARQIALKIIAELKADGSFEDSSQLIVLRGGKMVVMPFSSEA